MKELSEISKQLLILGVFELAVFSIRASCINRYIAFLPPPPLPPPHPGCCIFRTKAIQQDMKFSNVV